MLTYHSSEKDDEIKPQGVISKIVVPVNNNIFTAPSEQVTPEQELGEATDDVYDNEDTSDVNANDLCITDDEEGLLSSEVLEDVGVIESDEEE